MLYIQRALQIRKALLQDSKLLEEIKQIFKDHLSASNNRVAEAGNSRVVYNVGICHIENGKALTIVLKLGKDRDGMTYSSLLRRGIKEELGAFEAYYDAVRLSDATLRFTSAKKHSDYIVKRRRLPEEFSLNEHWSGTSVKSGDMGAVPYFHLVVMYRRLFGLLTEGEPPLYEPLYTVDEGVMLGEHTTLNGRIIDLNYPAELTMIDNGGGYNEHHNNLGLWSRGMQYLRRSNRLELKQQSTVAP